MPVLKGILLSIDETGTLTMTASDMDLSIEKKMEVSDFEPGAVVLPAKLFTEIVRKLPSESIEIALSRPQQCIHPHLPERIQNRRNARRGIPRYRYCFRKQKNLTEQR